MFRTKYLKLTKEQKERGVIYSSVLIRKGSSEYTLHEVLDSDPDKWRKIENLKDVTFFKNMAREMGWDVVNEVRQ